ncbi:MAG: glycoside hydrolase family 9 protein [Candidatus Coatesbacteria bacterium]
MPLATLLVCAAAWAAEPQGLAETIVVDQFGWRPADRKIVVFAQPVKGYNVAAWGTFVPGDTFVVCRASDGASVFAGPVTIWNSGTVHEQSGDRAWHGDFSALTSPGTYYVQVPGGTRPGARSFDFRIADDVYAVPLRAACRSYYYQRCGTDLTEAFGGHWVHQACHVGPGQDLGASVYDGGPQGSPRDVHGGWHDAGDYRKYVPFTYATLFDLLTAVEWFPAAFGDATGIPESGNGVPDLLDEVKWELDWMLRMQYPDGSVATTVGVTGGDGGSPPEVDKGLRYQAGVSSPAASSLARACAQASRLFASYESVYHGYAKTLRKAAVASWGWLEKHPTNVRYRHQGFSQANANVGDADDQDRRIGAAAELFRLTGDVRVRRFIDDRYARFAPRKKGDHHPMTRGYFDASASMDLQMGLVTYALAPGATPKVVKAIKKSLAGGVSTVMAYADADPYLAHMWDGHYCWGSNSMKGKWGILPIWAIRLGVNPTMHVAYRARAAEYLHYLHGRNPLNLVYLSNMGSQERPLTAPMAPSGPRGANAGVGKSVTAFFHGWFCDKCPLYNGAGSTWGPAPGFLTGGPNMFYKPDRNPDGHLDHDIVPPQNQPPMKSYLDWGAGWPENSWEVTENGIYYEASYILLAAAFAAP